MELDYMVGTLKFDSVHRRFGSSSDARKDDWQDVIVIGGVYLRVFHEKDPIGGGRGHRR